jgi:hypothetical protein
MFNILETEDNSLLVTKYKPRMGLIASTELNDSTILKIQQFKN